MARDTGDEARHGGVDLALVPAVAAVLDAAIARGEGALDFGPAVRSSTMKPVIRDSSRSR